MLNQGAVINQSPGNATLSKKEQSKGGGEHYHVKLEVSKSAEPSNGKKKKIKSPGTARRLLPNTPNFLKANNSDVGKYTDEPTSKVKIEISKSTEDITKAGQEKSEASVAKYKYNSLPRKKKDSKSSKQSTFYVNGDSEDVNPQGPNNSPKLKRRSDSNASNTSVKENTAMNKQTHVALYKFYARHKDELAFLDGDPIQVLKIFDDLWYEGINLSTGKQGIFPCRYVSNIMSQEILSTIGEDSDHQQFHLRFLGSVEVSDYKGDEILCFAIAKVVNQRSLLATSSPPTCTLQVNSKGIRICNLDYVGTAHQEADRKPKKGKQIENLPTDEDNSHYFSLKNVTFCGNHSKDRRYFGFITKHPDEYRFACHIFMSKYSTDQMAKIIGKCFQTFYQNFMEYRAPTEDIYLE